MRRLRSAADCTCRGVSKEPPVNRRNGKGCVQGEGCGKQRTVCGCWVFYDAPLKQEKTVRAVCRVKAAVDNERYAGIGCFTMLRRSRKKRQGLCAGGKRLMQSGADVGRPPCLCGPEEKRRRLCESRMRQRKRGGQRVCTETTHTQGCAFPPSHFGNRHSTRAAPLACVETNNSNRERKDINGKFNSEI